MIGALLATAKRMKRMLFGVIVIIEKIEPVRQVVHSSNLLWVKKDYYRAIRVYV